ncbi:MAG: substrate-binding domain-containing protein, partial [Bryobacteraceae bacterium]
IRCSFYDWDDTSVPLVNNQIGRSAEPKAKSRKPDSASVLTRGTDKYFVPVLARALSVLECFDVPNTSLTLEEITSRSGVAHTTAYRILHTLVIRGYLSQQNGKLYKLNRSPKKVKAGFANLTRRTSFARAIEDSVRQAAGAAGLQLFVLDNDRDAQLAIDNAKAMIASRVDVAIEFQRYEQVAPVIVDMYSSAGIPLISTINPQHGTIYCGVDNYRAGWAAGQVLAEHAIARWKGEVDLLFLLDCQSAGPTVQVRMTGVGRSIESRLGPRPADTVVRLDSIEGAADTQGESCRITERVLQEHSKAKRILIATVDDEVALGARDAILKMNLQKNTAIMGQGGSPEIWAEIADPDSPCIGTVSFCSELYGPGLIDLVLSLVRGESVAPAHYIPYEVFDKHNIGTKNLAAVGIER